MDADNVTFSPVQEPSQVLAFVCFFDFKEFHILQKQQEAELSV